MKPLLVTVVLVLVLLLVGWLQFATVDGDPAIRLDTEKVKQDTEAVVEKAKEAVEAVDRQIDNDTETADKSPE